MLHQACESASIYIAPRSSPFDVPSRIDIIRAHLDALEDELADPGPPRLDLSKVRGYIAARKKVRQSLGADLFSDPAWEILVHLYAAELAQQRIALSKLCEVAGLATATGGRWLKELERTGHVERRQDRFDARRAWVTLTRSGAQKMRDYFASFA
jgi:DNA-binding MarR family transcriptional regulator